jgi:hypothetical protein
VARRNDGHQTDAGADMDARMTGSTGSTLRLRKPQRPEWPDRLSGWSLPPPSARAVGEVEPVRVFESAEAAMAFLARSYSVAK